MKIKDFYGKWFLREGDLRPEEINESSIKRYEFGIKHFDVLDADGLIFDSKKDAELASRNIRLIAKGIRDHTIVEEPKYDEYKRRVYISGPISGHNLEERRASFKKIQNLLEAQDYQPINPMENGLPAEATTHEHMKRDIELLMTCDMIYMMRRWTHSKGCKVEFDVAAAIGLPVLFEESGEIIEFE